MKYITTYLSPNVQSCVVHYCTKVWVIVWLWLYIVTDLLKAFLGNGSVTTFSCMRSDITPQQCLAITRHVFSLWSAVELCFVRCLCCGYITWARLQLREFLVEFRGSRGIEQELARRIQVIWSASFCVEIRCRETTSEDGESQCMCSGKLKVCIRSITLYWVWLRNSVTEVLINPIIWSRTRYFNHAYPHTCDSIVFGVDFMRIWK
jgi:hypothetical protein